MMQITVETVRGMLASGDLMDRVAAVRLLRQTVLSDPAAGTLVEQILTEALNVQKLLADDYRASEQTWLGVLSDSTQVDFDHFGRRKGDLLQMFIATLASIEGISDASADQAIEAFAAIHYIPHDFALDSLKKAGDTIVRAIERRLKGEVSPPARVFYPERYYLLILQTIANDSAIRVLENIILGSYGDAVGGKFSLDLRTRAAVSLCEMKTSRRIALIPQIVALYREASSDERWLQIVRDGNRGGLDTQSKGQVQWELLRCLWQIDDDTALNAALEFVCELDNSAQETVVGYAGWIESEKDQYPLGSRFFDEFERTSGHGDAIRRNRAEYARCAA